MAQCPECYAGLHGQCTGCECEGCELIVLLESDEESDDGEDDFDEFDCHMDRNGYCGKAGSEECEFECPYRNLLKG